MVKEGWHKLEPYKKFSKEWIPSTMAALQFKNSVLESLIGLTDDFPHYDTGYFKVDAGSDYTIVHGLSCIPKRMTAFFSPVSNPQEGKDYIYLFPFSIDLDKNNDQSGGYLKFRDNNTAVFDIPGSYVLHHTWTTGNVRIMFWR